MTRKISRASSYARAVKELRRIGPKPFVLFEYSTADTPKCARVMEDGRLKIDGDCVLDQDKALALARWITATFESEDG